MVYKKLYISIIIRVLLIIITAIWFAFEILNPYRIYTIIVVASLLFLQSYLLINQLNRFNNEIYRYFSSLRDEVSSTQFRIKNKSSDVLLNLINEVGTIIQEARIAKEQQLQFLNFIVETIPIGIIISDQKGNIILQNKIITKLFEFKSLRNLSEFGLINYLLKDSIDNLKIGAKSIVKVRINENYTKLLIGLSSIKIENKVSMIYTFQDVKSELDENEIKAWQKLIRVMNHELMNSITPITTLTHAIKRAIYESETKKLNMNSETPVLIEILKNTELIEERSQGLIKFINNYRKITSITKIEKTEFLISDLVKKIEELFKYEFQQENIKMTVTIMHENLKLNADRNLVEQVLINLIRNSIESFERDQIKEIKICSSINSSEHIEIEVTDNGKGIDESIIEDIFVPFYTTKKNGSGIGLSFSKNIMKMHDGEIKVKTESGKGSVFTLIF